MPELFQNNTSNTNPNEFGLRGRVTRELSVDTPAEVESSVILSGAEVQNNTTVIEGVKNRFSLHGKNHLLEYITPSTLAIAGVLIAAPVLYYVNFENFNVNIDSANVAKARQSLAVLTGDTASDVDIKIKQAQEDEQKAALVQALNGAQAAEEKTTVPAPATIRYNFAKIRESKPLVKKEIPDAVEYVPNPNPRTENLIFDRIQKQ